MGPAVAAVAASSSSGPVMTIRSRSSRLHLEALEADLLTDDSALGSSDPYGPLRSVTLHWLEERSGSSPFNSDYRRRARLEINARRQALRRSGGEEAAAAAASPKKTRSVAAAEACGFPAAVGSCWLQRGSYLRANPVVFFSPPPAQAQAQATEDPTAAAKRARLR